MQRTRLDLLIDASQKHSRMNMCLPSIIPPVLGTTPTVMVVVDNVARG